MTSESVQWDVPKVEECALQVVHLIERCVHAIRSIKEFQPSTLAKRTCDANPIQHVMLYTEMELNGVVDDVKQVQESVNFTISNTRKSDLDEMELSNERSRLVYRVLLPLVSSLESCYAVLDQIPAEAPPPETQSKSRRKQQQKPPPPRGMLSIQNYTDIAALLEFLVCTSILPNLQRHVLACAEDRARHKLPKALAGRIPRQSLLWGCAIQNSVPPKKEHLPRVVCELQRTAQALGSLVLLDRFRPMLLPRHLVDVYAAVLQAEAFESQYIKHHRATVNQTVEYRQLRCSLLLGDNGQLTSIPSSVVDTYSYARACQALLFQGIRGPPWLRQRVSRLLTDLACRDLAIIVRVFVQEGAASSQDMTGASMRLARALTGPSVVGSSDGQEANYHRRLCLQLLSLLDVAAVNAESDSTATVDPSREAGVLTVWAVLDQFPPKIFLIHLLPLLMDGLLPECNEESDAGLVSVHKTVKRVGTLLSFVPSASNPMKVLRLFLLPTLPPKCQVNTATGTKTNLFGQLLRVASAHSVLHSAVKEDAVWCLRLLVGTFCESSFKSANNPDVKGVEGSDVAAMVLLYSVALSMWDLMGFHYELLPSISKPGLDSVRVKLSSSDIHDIHNLTRQTEERAKVVVGQIIAPLSQTIDEPKSFDSRVESSGEPAKADHQESTLPSRMFSLLLMVYFSATANSTMHPQEQPQLPGVFRGNRSSFALTAMSLLPLLCEECSPLSLLLGSNDSDSKPDGRNGVLGMIKLILDCASSNFFGDEGLELENEGTRSTPENQNSHPFMDCDIVMCEILDLRDGKEIQPEDSDTSSYDVPTGNETLVSVASLVLSMLVALLELGSLSRTQGDEDTLNSMLPSLRSLASCTDVKMARSDMDESLAMASADLAEMASHAMALIACRAVSSVPLESQPAAVDTSPRIDPNSIIERAEKDLKSAQPPIRARGVVALRRLTRGYLSDRLTGDQTTLRDSPLIEEIDEETPRVGKGGADLCRVLEQVLRLLVDSLADSESYVYLAGVQTIVALADVMPQKILPALGRMVCQGIAIFSIIEPRIEIPLTEGQRVKVTESLVFSIRRRGAAVYQFVPYLMDLMIFGYQKRETSMEPREHKDVHELENRIGAVTLKYFSNGNGFEGDPDENEEQRRVHLNTGGPVFNSEESDLVRAACIAVTTELVSVSQPYVITGYCRVLVRLATNVLRLDRSRPIRRAAALLCRELYEAVLREYEDSSEMIEKNESMQRGASLAIEIVKSDEKLMFSTLEGCVAHTGIEGSDRVHDPATVARCQEAMNIRTLIEQEGIFAAAKLIANSTQREENDVLSRTILARLHDRTQPRNDSDAVRALSRLEVDSNSLKLL